MSRKKTVKKQPVNNKTAQTKTMNNSLQKEIDLESNMMINNGLSDAILGQKPFEEGNQISQVDTLFKNNRWYLISNMRQLLSEIYVEHGLVKTIVDVPVDDGLRGGVNVISKELDEDDIKELRVKMEEENDFATIGQAMKWTRLFGGGGVIIMTNQDPEKPLDIDSIKQGDSIEFRDVDMWELFWDMQWTGDYSATIDQSLNSIKAPEFYNYYGIKVHHSRVLRMTGLKAPSFVRPRLRGWGFSIVESLIRSINQYLKATDLTFEVLDEFKLDIYKIKGLTNALLQPNGSQKIYERVSLANSQKNYQNAITMDAEDDYTQKQLSFAGISDTMSGIRMQVASDLRIPMTKLFGMSSAGFNSGEDDIENYNSMIESEIRAKLKFHLLKIIKIRCLQLFGYIPNDIEIEFESLRMLSSEQEENIKTQKFSRLLQARQAGEVTAEEFRDACNKEGLLNIQLDKKSLRALEKENKEQQEEPKKELGTIPKTKQSKLTPKEAKS